MPQVAVGKKARALSALLILLSACLMWAREIDCPPGCSPGRWSTDAIDLSSQRAKAPYKDRDIRVYAPDHQKSVHVVNDHWWAEVAEEKISPPQNLSVLLYPAELAWAPNSEAFFITDSVGYSTGYRTEVYRIVDDKLIGITKLAGIIGRDFDRYHRCFNGQVGNAPNVAGFKWLDDSNRLLMIAEVPPIGICKEAKYFGGYEISVRSGRILDRFSPQQVSDRWGELLGERLKGNLEFLSADEKTKVP